MRVRRYIFAEDALYTFPLRTRDLNILACILEVGGE